MFLLFTRNYTLLHVIKIIKLFPQRMYVHVAINVKLDYNVFLSKLTGNKGYHLTLIIYRLNRIQYCNMVPSILSAGYTL